MSVLIQSPKPNYVPAIASIWHAGWHEAHAPIVPKGLTDLRTLDSMQTRSAKYLDQTRVALIDGQVAGFCMVLGDELYQMYVAPQARGTGAAGALMADAEQRIAKAGNSVAWLSCAIGNDRAARFYEKSGWANAGEETFQLEASAGAFALTTWRFEKPVKAAD